MLRVNRPIFVRRFLAALTAAVAGIKLSERGTEVGDCFLGGYLCARLDEGLTIKTRTLTVLVVAESLRNAGRASTLLLPFSVAKKIAPSSDKNVEARA